MAEDGPFFIDRRGDLGKRRAEDDGQWDARKIRSRLSLSPVLACHSSSHDVPLDNFVQQDRVARKRGRGGRGGHGGRGGQFSSVTVTDFSGGWARPPKHGLHGLIPRPHIRIQDFYQSMRLSGCLLCYALACRKQMLAVR